jgi:hypothetical protein
MIVNISFMNNNLNLFKDNGYLNEKPFINIFGKSIYLWILDNLQISFENIECIYILYPSSFLNYNFEEKVIHYFNEKNIKNINNIPQILFYKVNNRNDKNNYIRESIINLEKYIHNIDTIPILNISDNYFFDKNIYNFNFKSNNLFYMNNAIFEDIFYLNSVKLYKNIIDYFNDWNIEITINSIENFIKYYKIEFCKNNLDSEFIHNISSPFHLRIFCNNYPRIHSLTREIKIERRKIVFDFEDTLFTSELIPNHKNINLIKYLKKLGNIIGISTLLEDIPKNISYLNSILEPYGINYDYILFKRDTFDYYIGNKNINDVFNIDKQLGYYNTSIDPRDFNNVSDIDNNVILKKSDENLSCQIEYYLNIPNELKDIFPIFIDYDRDNYKWYRMEKIYGIPVSKLFLAKELTIEQFISILDTLKRIHKVSNDTCKKTENFMNNMENMYKNYSQKMIKRYADYDYSKFKDSDKIYNFILHYLKEYENKDMGIYRIIHGDPVFTNIIINRYGKIKMIDMRGKLGNNNTIYGDILYDWAKIYQSLLGYDEFLEEIYLPYEYKNKFICEFERIFIEKFGEKSLFYMKIITASLLFSLIPLHNNEKCLSYYNLIFEIDIIKNENLVKNENK